MAQAARLLGSAEALREAISAPMAPAYRGIYEARILAPTRAALDAAAFAAAWAAGRALPLDQAIAEALRVAEVAMAKGGAATHAT